VPGEALPEAWQSPFAHVSPWRSQPVAYSNERGRARLKCGLTAVIWVRMSWAVRFRGNEKLLRCLRFAHHARNGIDADGGNDPSRVITRRDGNPAYSRIKLAIDLGVRRTAR
jgi:hypothetical protein